MEYSRNIAEFLTANLESQEYKSYRAGIIFLICVLGGIAFIWCFFLMWLKLNSETVGCAAGQPFKQDVIKKQKNDDKRKLKKSVESQSTDVDESIHEKQETDNTCSMCDEKGFLEPRINSDNETSNSVHLPDASLNGSCLATVPDDPSSVASLPPRPSKREKRTQVVFLLFGVFALVCIPLVAILAYKPLTRIEQQSVTYITDMWAVINEINASLEILTSASEASIDLIANKTFDFGTSCPSVDPREIEAATGLNLSNILSISKGIQMKLTKQITFHLSKIILMKSYLVDAVTIVEQTYETTDDYLWIVPIFLVGLIFLILVALFGVMLAWRRESSKRLQHFLSCSILPLLILSSICCWTAAIGFAVATAVGSDACTGGSPSGAPNETVIAVIESSSLAQDHYVRKFITEYVGGCHGDDPAEAVLSAKAELNAFISYIWMSLSTLDSVGRQNIEQLCTGSNAFESFFKLQDLGKLLTAISQALDATAAAISCKRLNPIYSLVVNQSACSDVADAAAWGFILFLLLGLFTMTMISIRASWYYNINEDKIYDESDVAENMVLDEHEEYLKYISKYKHEWEEYQGLANDLPNSIRPPGFKENEIQARSTTSHQDSETGILLVGLGTDLNSCNAKQPCSDIDDLSLEYSEAEYGSKQDPFDPYYSTDCHSQSTAGDSISFLSLRELSSKGSEESMSMKRLDILPPPLLFKRTTSQDTEAQADEDIIPSASYLYGLKSINQYSKSRSNTETATLQENPTQCHYKNERSDREPVQREEHSLSLRLAQTNSANAVRSDLTTKDQLMKQLDEIGSDLMSTTGVNVSLSLPPKSIALESRSMIYESQVGDHTKYPVMKHRVRSFTKS